MFRETPTACVTCGIPMVEAETSTGSHVEVCDKCGGAWMEVATFLANLRSAQPKLAVDELMEHNDGTPRRPCPKCGDKMAIVWLDFLQLDQCEPHGVWFDTGELHRALDGDVVPAEVKDVLKRAALKGGSRLVRTGFVSYSSWVRRH